MGKSFEYYLLFHPLLHVMLIGSLYTYKTKEIVITQPYGCLVAATMYLSNAIAIDMKG